MFNLGVISMKKTLVAIAALAAVSSFAQSSATIYGRMDLGFSTETTKKTNAGNAANATSRAKATSLAGAQGELTGMRLGFRGTEDLGGGLNLGFVIETRVNPDSTASTFGNSRLGNLSLTGGFGRVTIGTYDNAMDVVRGYAPTISGIAGGDTLGKTSFTNGVDGRSTNAIAYSTAVGPLTFGIGTVNESTSTSANPGNNLTQGKTSGVMVGLGYANGPLAANLAIASAKQSGGVVLPVSAVNGGKVSDVGFAVSYDLGVAKPWFQYETVTAKSVITNGVAQAGSEKANIYSVGASFPMGAFTPYIGVGRGTSKDTVGNPALPIALAAKLTDFQIGTRYSLSKRSTVYAAYGTSTLKNTTGGAGARESAKTSGMSLGLRHDF
jgi:predicted porin